MSKLISLHLFLALMFLILMIPVPVSIAAPASGPEAKVGLGIEKLELTGASDSLEIAPDTKVYAWSRVTDIPAGSTVSIILKKGDKEVYKKDVPVPSVPYRIFAYRTFRSGDGGDWSLVIAGPDGKEIVSSAFKVSIKK
jgi:Protein of unknown function (DUF2914)